MKISDFHVESLLTMMKGMVINMSKTNVTKSSFNDNINYKAPIPRVNRPYLQNIPHSRPNRIYVANNSAYYMPRRATTIPSCEYDNYDMDMDIVNIKRLYPSTVRSLEPYINEECDKLDYEGSFMYDENPDKVSVERIVDRIYEKTNFNNDEPDLRASYMTGRGRQDNRRDIITIILLNEFLNRRRRCRNRRRCY